PCKHLWSALLALAESSPEQQPLGKDRLSLRKDGPAAWRDLGVQVPEEPSRPGLPLGPGLSRRGPRPRRGRDRQLGAGLPAAAWRGQLAAIREEVSHLVSDGPPAAPASGIAGIRLLVNAASPDSGGLVLD